MIKSIKYILLVFSVFVSALSVAQTTTSTPYSQFGLGDLSGFTLPQNRAMGGITQGIRKPGAYHNINLANPASYSSIRLTTFDIGAYSGLRELSKTGLSENSFNATLSHIAFAFPVTTNSGISFGLLPFSQRGYQYKIANTIDTTNVNYVYGGDGGLSKAYFGYGIGITKNLSLGANVGYLFGNLKQLQSTEFPDDFQALNSRTENSNSVSGLTYDLGLQYSANLSSTSKLTLGYTANTGNQISSSGSVVTTRYRRDLSGEELPVLDTTFFREGAKVKVNMPLTHTIGFAFEKANVWVFGADAHFGKWSDFREGGNNPGLSDSYGVAVGGQITPDVQAVSNYLKLIDYRLGFKYDKTYISINNNDIDQYALTLGLGLPLPSNRNTTFYKINLSAELGRRGTLENNLIRERFVNIHLGFTLNDRWFEKPKFD